MMMKFEWHAHFFQNVAYMYGLPQVFDEITEFLMKIELLQWRSKMSFLEYYSSYGC